MKGGGGGEVQTQTPLTYLIPLFDMVTWREKECVTMSHHGPSGDYDVVAGA